MEQPLDPPREEEKAFLKELAGGGRQDIYHLYLEGQFAPGGDEDRIVGVTLSKDRAVLGIFKKQGATLQPLGFVVTLPLEELRLVSLEGKRRPCSPVRAWKKGWGLMETIASMCSTIGRRAVWKKYGAKFWCGRRLGRKNGWA